VDDNLMLTKKGRNRKLAKVTHEDTHNMFSAANIIRMIKSRRFEVLTVMKMTMLFWDVVWTRR
jgi:hypothetical protein